MSKKEQPPRSREVPDEPAAEVIGGSPEDAVEMINKYGTYNIQPTADSDHLYPAIAQGLPKVVREKEHEAE